MRTRKKKAIENLLLLIKKRRIEIYKRMLWESYFSYGRCDGNFIYWNYGAEIAEDYLINLFYSRIEKMLLTKETKHNTLNP